MLFNSWEFLIFFGIVCALYFSFTLRAQNVLLLLASYFFYSWWDWRFSGLLLLSTVVDYHVALRMESAEALRRRRLLMVSICTNLGILGLFKYFNFFADSLAGLLTPLGLAPHPLTLQIVLPVGISFYTFQTMAYTIDVYRGRLRAERDPVVFGIYVAFFPQLVAGPIERARNLLPQFRAPRRVTADRLASGGLLILIGLVRKMAIADVAAAHVDRVFAATGSSTSMALICGVALFALQIYCDFAGYSDIARGCSRILGIELMENFNHPYFATNITEFWRRWHISLSTWLRDYLYISLGGNRGPKWFVYRNLMLTMLLGGLWHGAAWTFVVWGGLHGLALVAHKLWLRGRPVPERAAPRTPGDVLRAAAGWLLTMGIVAAGWVFFRAPDFGTALEVFRGILSLQGGIQHSGARLLVQLTMLLLVIDVPQYLMRDHTIVLRWPWMARGVVYAAAVLMLVLIGAHPNAPFIYFQF